MCYLFRTCHLRSRPRIPFVKQDYVSLPLSPSWAAINLSNSSVCDKNWVLRSFKCEWGNVVSLSSSNWFEWHILWKAEVGYSDHNSLQLDISSTSFQFIPPTSSYDSPLFSYLRIIICSMSSTQETVHAANSTTKLLSSLLSYPFLLGP